MRCWEVFEATCNYGGMIFEKKYGVTIGVLV